MSVVVERGVAGRDVLSEDEAPFDGGVSSVRGGVRPSGRERSAERARPVGYRPARTGARRSVTVPAPPPVRGRPARSEGVRSRGHLARRGEVLRPPTRARVVAGHGRRSPVGCAPRSIRIRWIALAGIALAVCAVVIGLGSLAGSMAAPVPQETTLVFVEAGQTAWDLASEFAPASSPEDVVARISEINELAGSGLQPGAALAVPVDPAVAAGLD